MYSEDRILGRFNGKVEPPPPCYRMPRGSAIDVVGLVNFVLPYRVEEFGDKGNLPAIPFGENYRHPQPGFVSQVLSQSCLSVEVWWLRLEFLKTRSDFCRAKNTSIMKLLSSGSSIQGLGPPEWDQTYSPGRNQSLSDSQHRTFRGPF